MEINFNLRGFAQVKSKLSNLSKSLTDFKVPFGEAGEELVQYFGQQVFDDQGFNGQPWAPWALSTVIQRLKRTGNYKSNPEREDQILNWTGRMHRSFFSTVTEMKLIIANTSPYFPYHQMGTTKMTARCMLVVNKDVITTVRSRVEAYTKSLISTKI